VTKLARDTFTSHTSSTRRLHLQLNQMLVADDTEMQTQKQHFDKKFMLLQTQSWNVRPFTNQNPHYIAQNAQPTTSRLPMSYESRKMVQCSNCDQLFHMKKCTTTCITCWLTRCRGFNHVVAVDCTTDNTYQPP